MTEHRALLEYLLKPLLTPRKVQQTFVLHSKTLNGMPRNLGYLKSQVQFFELLVYFLIFSHVQAYFVIFSQPLAHTFFYFLTFQQLSNLLTQFLVFLFLLTYIIMRSCFLHFLIIWHTFGTFSQHLAKFVILNPFLAHF